MDDHFAPLKLGMWVLFGNTLYLSDKPGDFLVFPGDVGTAQRLRDAHNAAMTAERERCAAAVERAASVLPADAGDTWYVAGYKAALLNVLDALGSLPDWLRRHPPE